MGKVTVVNMPDGQQWILPLVPKTWIDVGPTTPGDALRARLLEADAGTGILWHRQRPLFQGFPGLAQSIPTATFTAITGLSELIDNWSGHSDTTNTGRYFVPNTASNTTGGDWYLCSGYVPFNSTDATTPFTAGLRDTGSATVLEGGKVPSGAGHVVDTMVIDLMQMHGGNGDYVELMARQVTGAAVNTIVSGKSPSLTVRWVAADQAWSGFATPALPAVPHTWTASDLFTGSATGGARVPLNTELRDFVNFLNNPPIARLTSEGTSQTIPNGGVFTSIQLPTETVDTYGGHDNVTNNTRYTCQRAGLYLISGYVSIAEGAGGGTNNGYRAARLLQTIAAGGTQTYAGWTSLPQASTGTTGTGIYATALVRMAAGDYVELQLAHTQTNATVTRAVNSAANNCSRLLAVWMAA
jgi:hypothetical protein